MRQCCHIQYLVSNHQSFIQRLYCNINTITSKQVWQLFQRMAGKIVYLLPTCYVRSNTFSQRIWFESCMYISNYRELKSNRFFYPRCVFECFNRSIFGKPIPSVLLERRKCPIPLPAANSLTMPRSIKVNLTNPTHPVTVAVCDLFILWDKKLWNCFSCKLKKRTGRLFTFMPNLACLWNSKIVNILPPWQYLHFENSF